jgi:hypothetical protein
MNFAGMGAWLIRKVMRDKRVEEAATLLKQSAGRRRPADRLPDVDGRDGHSP